MNDSIYDVEIYDEGVFMANHPILKAQIEHQITEEGRNPSDFSFTQCLVYGGAIEVLYTNNGNEDETAYLEIVDNETVFEIEED